MTLRKFAFAPDEVYHVYTRGVEKRLIFLDPNDYFRFQLLLYVCNAEKGVPLSKTIRGIAHEMGITQSSLKHQQGTSPSQHPVLTREREAVAAGYDILERSDLMQIFSAEREAPMVDVLAYTLMPNHFHLVLKERAEGGVTQFMHKLTMAYAKHFNTKYQRVGSLFVRPFKAKHIDTDPYFMHIFWYVHLNPIELVTPRWKDRKIENDVKVQTFMHKYKWSSYYDYSVRERPERSILSLGEVPDFIRISDSLKDAIKQYRETEYVEDQV